MEFLEKIEAATGVTDFITDIWPGIKDADDLEKALREIFRKQFDDMFREFTYQWVLAEDPVLATEVEEITKPAEAFIQGWSGELARIMNLNTKDSYGAFTAESTGKEMVYRGIIRSYWKQWYSGTWVP